MPMTATQKIKAKEVQAAITVAIKEGKEVQDIFAMIRQHFPSGRPEDLSGQIRDIDHEIGLRRQYKEDDNE